LQRTVPEDLERVNCPESKQVRVIIFSAEPTAVKEDTVVTPPSGQKSSVPPLIFKSLNVFESSISKCLVPEPIIHKLLYVLLAPTK
jgi:hypothetical protein